MTTAVGPDDPRWLSLFNTFKHTCFRVETRQQYASAAEADVLKEFLAGHAPAIYQDRIDFLRGVQDDLAAGKLRQRVHIVSEPLTDYLRFQIEWSYPMSAEDIRILPAEVAYEVPEMPDRDFWLFDSRTLAMLDYDDDGRMVRVSLEDDPAVIVEACAWRDAAMHLAVPLRWWAAPSELPRHAHRHAGPPAADRRG
jgi:hypothetical protein